MKQKATDLALLGGKPAFAEPLHVGRPNIGDKGKLLERIEDMLDRRWLSNNGPFVQELEARIAKYLGVRNCIAMCNGTVALEIAIRALGLKGEVIVPSFTFIATPHSLQWQEITPVFCDVDPRTHCLDPKQVERLLTPRTSGIIGVHVWGRPCDTQAIEEIAARRRLAVMYDASHAFGCSHEGKFIGNFGQAEVFSFHATKFFNTFEGGAITTNDDDLARRIRLMKNFGFAGFDNVIYLGVNGKMSEVSAAMGLTGMDCLDSFLETNERNYRCYQRGLEGIPGVRLYQYEAGPRWNFQYVVAEVSEHEAGISRDLLVKMFHAENVVARRYFYPGCHRMEPYRSYFPHAGLLLPETESLCERILILPTGTAIGEAEIGTICGLLRLGVAHAAEIVRSQQAAQATA
ncbi:MAG: DegT/DnrJ/EryC1/StrS family aminotransferase [Bryobacteraceae bacterium]|nr:DegT/DnrJ/EryC1/StrS family aminotransferase [Bryobacteraceae bacterium]